MPTPTWNADRPTIWVKKTALPVRKTPSPIANRIDCRESLRARGVSGISEASQRGVREVIGRDSVRGH